MSIPGAPAYTQGSGTDSLSVAKPILLSSAPSSSYGALLPIGQRVIVQSTNSDYVLTSKSTVNGVTTVTWTIAGSPTGDVSTLTGDSGTATPVAGNIKIAGTANQITTTASGSTVTNSLPSAITTPGSLTTTTTLTGGTGVTATTGSVTATAGMLFAGGDTAGVASTTAISSTSSATISTGVGSVKMSSANPGTNTAWIKIYIGTSAFWIPAWTTNAP
jgi:hypothetical protein